MRGVRDEENKAPYVPTVLGQVVTLNLSALQSDWQGVFDHMQVWRSTTGRDGPYVELTADDWAPPIIPSAAGPVPGSPVTGQAVAINGLTLSLLLNETSPLNYQFTGGNPITFQAAAIQLTAAFPEQLLSYVDSTGLFVIRGIEPGNKAILHITGGDAAPLLGLPTVDPTDYAYGKDARIELITGQNTYQYVDTHGDPTYWYQTRYSNRMNGQVSEYSLPFAPSAGGGATANELILGTIQLQDASGLPVANRQVSIAAKFGGQVVGGIGVIPRDSYQLTDSTGYAEFTLLRGLQVTVSVAGTQLVRDVNVPTDPTLSSFGLLDPGVGSNDVFVVQVPDVDFAVRRSL